MKKFKITKLQQENSLLHRTLSIGYIQINHNTKEIIYPASKTKYIKSRKFIKRLLEEFNYKLLAQIEIPFNTPKQTKLEL
jgi:hypothetical protein